MNKQDTILPDSISIYPHLLAIDLAVKRMTEKVPLEVLLVYLVDNVPAAALPILAAQFDVLGYKGMRLAQTEQDQRNLIKRAIELHRYKGTVWAIEEAIKSIGFTDIKIIEHVNGHWANFRVEITNNAIQLNDGSVGDIISMIKAYKNTRSHLVDVLMQLQFDDALNVGEDVAYISEEIRVEDNLYLTGSLFYDGTNLYNGTFDHSGENDVVIITQNP